MCQFPPSGIESARCMDAQGLRMLYFSKSKVYKDTALAVNIVQEVPWLSSQCLVELS